MKYVLELLGAFIWYMIIAAMLLIVLIAIVTAIEELMKRWRGRRRR